MSGTMGPNVKRLIAHKMSLDAIPPGGGLLSGIKFLSNKDGIIKSARDSRLWVENAIRLVRTGTGDNPWREADDETIAGVILEKIEERKMGRKA